MADRMEIETITLPIFRDKVWEPTGMLPDGRPTWSSRPATAEDWQFRRDYMEGFNERQRERYTEPDRVLRREG